MLIIVYFVADRVERRDARGDCGRCHQDCGGSDQDSLSDIRLDSNGCGDVMCVCVCKASKCCSHISVVSMRNEMNSHAE